MSLLFTNAEVEGQLVDVRAEGGIVSEVAPKLQPRDGENVIEARAGALIPGLHDHHLHLLAMAAAAESVNCGPPAVNNLPQLETSLRRGTEALAPDAWIRGTDYHEAVAGPLDRHVLDRLIADRPLRVQHRGGALWMLNSAALELIGPALDHSSDVERDAHGRLNGRLWRYDDRLRRALATAPPDLAPVGARLTALGITGVTDATPDLDAAGQILIADAIATGVLAVAVHLLGAPLNTVPASGLTLGPLKLLLRDHDLPSLDALVRLIEQSHHAGRPVAVHCVTRESLLLTLVAIEQVGPLRGDRIEHAAIVPENIAAWIARLGLHVVTQPCFVSARGDDYLADVEPEDRPFLYPYASLLDAGVLVVPSSDAPFGELDPWRNMKSAVTRLTSSGFVLGPYERVTAAAVFAGYLSPAAIPGGPPRRIRPGIPADLCLLRESLERVLGDPDAGQVRMTVKAGTVLN